MKRIAGLMAAGAAALALGSVALAQDPQQQPTDPNMPVAPQEVPQTTLPAPQVSAEPDAESGPRLQAAGGIKMRALDKITGNSTDINAKVGQTASFGRIKVKVRACYQSSPQDAPEAAAFLEIFAQTPKDGQPEKTATTSNMNRGPQPIGEDGLLFSGWMYASTPGLNALEHPTYDVWVISCSASSPQ